MRRFSSSLDLDLELAHEDIEGSLAHVRMLGEVGVLPVDEAEAIAAGLEKIAGELADGSWTPDDGYDDIHMAVEARLVELVGEVGGKLHTARSRNDQVATAVRLWLKRRLADLDGALCTLISTLLDRVEIDGRTLMPGYTHLQRGQADTPGPPPAGPRLGADPRPRTPGVSARSRGPVPTGRLRHGRHQPPHRPRIHGPGPGFAGVVVNAMDAVSARDHLQEVAAVLRDHHEPPIAHG